MQFLPMTASVRTLPGPMTEPAAMVVLPRRMQPGRMVAPGATRTVSSMRMPSHRGMETPEASSAVSSASRAGSVLGMGILLF